MRVETSTFLNGHWDLHSGPHAYPTSPHMHLVFLESPLLCAGLLLPSARYCSMAPTNNLAISCLRSKYLSGPHVSKYLQLLVSQSPVLQCICGLCIWYQFLCFYSLCIYYQYIHMRSKWSSVYDPSCVYILISKQASWRKDTWQCACDPCQCF